MMPLDDEGEKDAQLTRQPPLTQTPADGLVCLGIVAGTHGDAGCARQNIYR